MRQPDHEYRSGRVGGKTEASAPIQFDQFVGTAYQPDGAAGLLDRSVLYRPILQECFDEVAIVNYASGYLFRVEIGALTSQSLLCTGQHKCQRIQNVISEHGIRTHIQIWKFHSPVGNQPIPHGLQLRVCQFAGGRKVGVDEIEGHRSGGEFGTHQFTRSGLDDYICFHAGARKNDRRDANTAYPFLDFRGRGLLDKYFGLRSRKIGLVNGLIAGK